MNEQWKVIESHKNYAVSNKGNVKNLKFNRLLKTFTGKEGYLLVNLWDNGKMSQKKVHRLVLMAFVPNLDGKPQVNHKDGNKQNNTVENLEWCTNSENQTHRRKVLQKNGGGLQRKKVLCVELEKIYPSIMEAERQTGIQHQQIGRCLNGKRKSAGGKHWEYVKDIV